MARRYLDRPLNLDLTQHWYYNQPAGSTIPSINIFDAWKHYSGQGVRVLVSDSGMQANHPDLAANVDLTPRFLNGVLVTGDPVQDTRDGVLLFNSDGSIRFSSHGTSVAGIIAATNDGVGAVGIAYDSTLVGARTGQFATRPETIAFFRNFDVVNASWSPQNNFNSVGDVPGILTALGDAANNGRNGLGTIVVKSAGNDRLSYDSGLDGLRYFGEETSVQAIQQSRFTIDVASVGRNGSVSNYSDSGATLLVSAPSNNWLDGGYTALDGTYTTRIANIDQPDLYDGSFGGTSAATPIVSGVVALMLEANPLLGWRDVQQILALTARHVGSDINQFPNGLAGIDGLYEESVWRINGAKEWNNGGYHFSNDYGFGLIDASAAVRLAETWDQQQTLANEAFAQRFIPMTREIETRPSMFDPAGATGFSFTLTEAIRAEYVEINFENFFDTFENNGVDMRYVTITLTSPDGTQSLLIDRPGFFTEMGPGLGNRYNLDGEWAFGTNAFRGQLAAGTWNVSVRATQDGPPYFVLGAYSNPSIRVYGRAETPDAITYFTDEFGEFWDLGRRNLTDADGGIDTINTAAVSTGSLIDLRFGVTNIIAGGTLVISQTSFHAIENAIGGGGNDQITGNAWNNRLNGHWGNDTLSGLGGQDVLIGSVGDDTYNLADVTEFTTTIGGQPFTLWLWDQVIEEANEGVDTVRVTLPTVNRRYDVPVFVENATIMNSIGGELHGNDENNTLTGNSGDDLLFGNNGDDSLDGGFGVDTLIGGVGNDYYFLNDQNFYSLNQFSLRTWRYDIVVEETLGGYDTVIVAPDLTFVTFYTLTDNVENGIITGSATFNLTGNALDNLLAGNSAANTLTGLGGNDRLIGGAGYDLLVGGQGNDTYVLSDLSLIWTGALNDDGEPEYAQVYDVVSEQLDGGIDTIELTPISGFSSWTMAEPIENFYLNGNANFSITGNAADNTILGNDGENFIRGLGGDDRLQGGSGFDTLAGGTGNDTYLLTDANLVWTGAFDDNGEPIIQLSYDRVIEDADGGEDTVLVRSVSGLLPQDYTLPDYVENGIVSSRYGSIYLTGNTSNNLLVGNFDANLIRGLAGVDRLVGQGDNDQIEGGDDADVLMGGFETEEEAEGVDGDDTVLGGEGDDLIIISFGADTVDGGIGFDRMSFGWVGADITVSLRLNASSFFESGSYTLPGMIGGWTSLISVTYQNIEGLIGGSGNDTLGGDDAANAIEGGIGNDNLQGGAGADTIDGGEGSDTVDYAAEATEMGVTGAVRVNLGAAAYDLGALGGGSIDASTAIDNTGDTDALVGIENTISGGGNDVLVGGSGANVIEAGDGDDWVDGGVDGEDSLNGGDGSADMAAFLSSTSGVTVDLALQGAAQDVGNGRMITLAGFEGLAGSLEADALSGDGGNNVLLGFAGDDQLLGGAGNDTLNGAEGTDVLLGGDGDDVLADGQSIGDVNTLDGGTGNDTADYSSLGGVVYADLRSGVGYVDGSYTDQLVSIENIHGGSGNDVIVGDDGVNVLNGAGGTDELYGFGGDDTLAGGAAAAGSYNVLFGGEGKDTASYAGTSATVYADLRALAGFVDGTAAANFVDAFNSIENLTGGSNNDLLVGNDDGNVLNGGAGVDELYGFGGDDTLIGGGALGGGAPGSYNILVGGDGIDTVSYLGMSGDVYADLRGFAGFLNGTALDNLIDVFSGIESLAGGSGNDLLVGDEGANQLVGAAGSDQLYGFGGDDLLIAGTAATGSYNLLIGGSGSDTASYAGTAQSVYADLALFGGYVGGTDLANLTDIYDGIENLIGGSVNDTLRGDNGDNRIQGSGGGDILYGLSGMDTFVYQDVADSNLNSGYDIIGDFATGIDKIDFTTFGIASSKVAIASGDGTTIVYADTDAVVGYDLAIVAIGNNAVAMTDILF